MIGAKHLEGQKKDLGLLQEVMGAEIDGERIREARSVLIQLAKSITKPLQTKNLSIHEPIAVHDIEKISSKAING